MITVSKHPNYDYTDCYVLRTPTILPQHSHIVKLTLHFYAHVGACPKVIHPLLCKHKWSRPFDTVIFKIKKRPQQTINKSVKDEYILYPRYHLASQYSYSCTVHLRNTIIFLTNHAGLTSQNTKQYAFDCALCGPFNKQCYCVVLSIPHSL